jgi:hypothetical protein
MTIFERLLEEYAEHAAAGTEHHGPEGHDNEPEEKSRVAHLADHLFGNDEEDLPEWAASPTERLRRWQAIDKILKDKSNATDEERAELRDMWIGKFGELPKNALSGRLGGALAGDRARAARRAQQAQQARNRSLARWPDAARLEAGSPLESKYGEQPPVRHSETPKGCYDRWPDAMRIRGV